MYRPIVKKLNIPELVALIKSAGDVVMDIYQKPYDVTKKENGSPVTIADYNANKLIVDFLAKHYPYPILSEENDEVPYEIRKTWKTYWLIDPLDGTKEFINKRREFTVNIALIHRNSPIMGMVYSPVFKDLFWACKGQGSFYEYNEHTIKLKTKSKFRFNNGKIKLLKNKFFKIILSRSTTDTFNVKDFFDFSELPTFQMIAMGSSLKFCRLAQGNVDVYFRAKNTMEWDTAAAQLIVEEAGRKLVQLKNGEPLTYNKESLVNPHFVAY